MRPAAEDPQTATALAAHQAGALRWLGGGVMAVVLGILLGAATVALVGDTGRHYSLLGFAVLALVLFGISGAIAGIGALVRTTRWRHALAATVWRTGRLRIAGPAIVAFEPEGYDELDPDDTRVHLRLLSTAIWRTRAVQKLDGAEILAAPVGDRQWVLTAEGLGTLVGARTVPH
ncbi:hypothetical protein [Petropleomorpha daqingensis]|uniref:Uncharacterized protein n=1 Tax=Petropleomorpha daqingensis TaxID=2026353 RepID=A0A853CG33_9ACTN|nr:hypothetical protein [Petropleomorpha daqingensis]